MPRYSLHSTYPASLLFRPAPPHQPLRPRIAAALLCVPLLAGKAFAAPPTPSSPAAAPQPAAQHEAVPAAASGPRAAPEPDAPPGGAPAGTAAATEQSAFRQALRQAGEAARAGNFDAAATSAQQAYALAANPYERIRAADWYASMREEQGRYDPARGALHTIRPLIRCVYGSHDMARSMAQEARLAFLQNRRTEAYALLAEIRDMPLSAPAVTWGQTDRDDWIPEGRQARLYYRLAGMSFPGAAGGLMREEYKTTDDPSDSSTLIYTPIAPQGPLQDMKVRLRVGSRDRHGTTVAQALAHELSYERELYGRKPHGHEAGEAPKPDAVPVEFAPAGSTHASGAVNIADEHGGQEVHGVWIARKGAWQIIVRASWAPQRQAAAAKALRALFADIGWNAHQARYRGQTPQTRALNQRFDTALANQQWTEAAALAKRLLPTTLFPNRQARLYTAMGIAAARSGSPARAMPLLRKAFGKWRYSKLGYGSESLFDTLLLYAADTAFRAGDTRQAVTWLNAHNRDLPDPNWKLDTASGALLYLPMNLNLPARLGDFMLVNHDRNLARYVRLHPDQAIGVTLMKPAPGKDPEDMEDLLRNWMTHKMELQVGKATELSYPQATRGDAHGRMLQFTVARPDASRSGVINIGTDALPPTGQRLMTFWLSRVADREIVLRTETAAGDTAALAAAGKAAASFPWPVAASSAPPAAGDPWALSCAVPAMAATPKLP